jgi:hypothetical protein
MLIYAEYRTEVDVVDMKFVVVMLYRPSLLERDKRVRPDE